MIIHKHTHTTHTTHTHAHTHTHTPAHTQGMNYKNNPFISITIKCLLKIIKALPGTIDYLELNNILYRVNNFLLKHNAAPTTKIGVCV